MLIKLKKLLVILILLYQTPLYSKSTSFDDINIRNLSSYFSGIVAYENKNTSDALKYFNASKILFNKHSPFLKKYINSLVLENKVAQAINVIKTSSKKNSLDFFEAHILLIIDNLKKNNFERAKNQLIQISQFQNQSKINLVIIESLRQYIYVFREKKISSNKKKFGVISLVSETFQRCYLDKENTEYFFLSLINNQQGDYSRYVFFYLNYLVKNKIG